MNIRYVIPRFIRHILPDEIAKKLLEQRFIIKPGIETSDPTAAVQSYLDALTKNGFSIKGKRVLIFGYGGRYDVGLGLVEKGATQVVLSDLFTSPDPNRNRALLQHYPILLTEKEGIVVPKGNQLLLVQGNIEEKAIQEAIGKVDLVLTNSVYEHLVNVDNITRILAEMLLPGGAHFHKIDLRDHFFKYPFEMLTFSESTWRRWLNPSSNHNRFRYNDYMQIFERYFENVVMEVTDFLPEAFAKIKSKIQPEFLTGDDEIDAIGQISVFASNPKQ
jgi:hypothetical protein